MNYSILQIHKHIWVDLTSEILLLTITVAGFHFELYFVVYNYYWKDLSSNTISIHLNRTFNNNNIWFTTHLNRTVSIISKQLH